MATALQSIPIDRIDTHSLQIGEATALALSGYSDTQIQKMGRWKAGASYIQGIHQGRTCVLLCRHVVENETELQIYKYIRQCIH
jgi:hypothetical protein